LVAETTTETTEYWTETIAIMSTESIMEGVSSGQAATMASVVGGIGLVWYLSKKRWIGPKKRVEAPSLPMPIPIPPAPVMIESNVTKSKVVPRKGLEKVPTPTAQRVQPKPRKEYKTVFDWLEDFEPLEEAAG